MEERVAKGFHLRGPLHAEAPEGARGWSAPADAVRHIPYVMGPRQQLALQTVATCGQPPRQKRTGHARGARAHRAESAAA